MAAKRFLMACALAMIFGSAGCQHWCERHYPCPAQAPACAAPAPCCQPTSYAPPAQAWNGPTGGGGMTCQCRPN